MRGPNEDRLTRIERLLAELSVQTTELHRLAVLTGEHQSVPTKPAKRRVRKKR